MARDLLALAPALAVSGLQGCSSSARWSRRRVEGAEATSSLQYDPLLRPPRTPPSYDPPVASGVRIPPVLTHFLACSSRPAHQGGSEFRAGPRRCSVQRTSSRGDQARGGRTSRPRATGSAVQFAIGLRARYGKPGTELAYGGQ
eukprot:1199836-Rhodomonas_salina.2